MTGPLRDRRGQGKGPNRRPPLGRPPRGPMQPGRAIGFWLVIIVLLFFGFQLIMLDRQPQHDVSFSTFLKEMRDGNIAEYIQNERTVTGKLAEKKMLPVDGGSHQEVEAFKMELPSVDAVSIEELEASNPNVQMDGKITNTRWYGLLTWLPFVVLIGLWLFFLRQMQAGGNRAFSFGKSKARLINADRPTVTFADVAGCDEAKVELEEIIEFLKSPRKFQRLGGRIPKGALLVGEPGTGKTLLAKAVAGEAGVPFFTMSGSDFVEMFVGVGASRVRDLFEQGKKHAPCIIFIDEIDAVGRHRGAGLGGGHDEREQTLNQLLVEMDGFDTNEGVILIAATNRPDVLDPALLRPGRFDRQIVVDMPDVRGREGILKVHLRKVQAGPDVDVRQLARGTPGMSGADLANIVNEGALLAARRNHEQVSMLDLEDAKEKVMMGPERRSQVISDERRKVTAYHEAGHAIVGYLQKDSVDEVHKVTIIPRGRAGGLTWFLPDEKREQSTKKRFLQDICTSMGGRAAEELIFPEITAGAYSDIKSATRTARNMVMHWGMSERLGPVALGGGSEPVFVGRDMGQGRTYSEQTAVAIDEEIHSIVSNAYETALSILRENMDKLHVMAEALLERETLDAEEVAIIMRGEALPEMQEAPEDPAPPTEDPVSDDTKQPDVSPGPILGGDAPPSTAG